MPQTSHVKAQKQENTCYYMHLFYAFILFRACRTAICKSRRGGFKDTLPEDLLAPLLKVFYFSFCLFFPPLSFCAQLMTITLVNQVSNPGRLSLALCLIYSVLFFSFTEGIN